MYYCYNKAGIKAKTARRYSGGISVLIKKSLRKGVKFFLLRVVSLYGGSWKSLSSILKRMSIYVLFTFPLQTLSILGKMKMILMMTCSQS